jgi:tetratricopeptide (TPR) repeat protein
LDLDDSLGEAHAAMAQVKFLQDWDWPAADQEFQRALDLSPNYTEGHHMYSHYLMAMGRFGESLSESLRFLELDPASPAPNLHLADHYLAARQYDQCIAQELKTLQIDPNYIRAHQQLGQAYWQKGMQDAAISEFDRQLSLSGVPSEVLARFRSAYKTSGWTGYIQSRLDYELERSKRTYVSPYLIGEAYALLDAKERALEWLERAYQEHDAQLAFWIRIAPPLDTVRNDARFQDLLRRMKLTT